MMRTLQITEALAFYFLGLLTDGRLSPLDVLITIASDLLTRH
jgi:hypothetical protein